MLSVEEPGVRNEDVRYTTRRSNHYKTSNAIIDIEPTTMEQPKTHSARSRFNAAEKATKRILRRSVSISIAELQRRHVRFRFIDVTSMDTDRTETVPLIPDKYNKTVRIQRANTYADIVTNVEEVSTLLTNVDCIATTSKTTEQAISKYKRRAAAISPKLRDIINPSTSRLQVNVIGKDTGSVQIGPRFVTVNQRVINTETLQATILGLQLQSRKPRKWREMRCGVVVFVMWSIVVSVGLLCYLYGSGMFGPFCSGRVNLDIAQEWYITRPEWKASDARNVTCLRSPATQVVIGHTETDFCIERDVCIKNVQEYQERRQIDRGWVDLGPNFLISGSGLVFEGRGANVQGSMIKDYNHISISIEFMGHYMRDKTCPEQFQRLQLLLNELVNKGVLVRRYRLLGHCQIHGPMISPGPNVMDELSHMDNWHSQQADQTYCVRR